MKRGGVKKSHSKLINLWIPETVIAVMDSAVQTLDTDRSKFIRQAIREKIQSVKGAAQ